ncbi:MULTISPECIES: hypothetical protein [unclassified Rhizobium]|uniref:hypothetical protein n=1 Tax=unclassified Rhizobium TaxID=2613769 RepID=UPI000715D7A6|nr:MULTISPECIES: hypothetical protein [unclassified Rhizobium]KQS88713.1 hypothetical protein ASG42_16060 [Rhizobium sp. Leaf391]KQT05656.1 hypothetical protein ASG50_14915 [Rhizobium sp. Leaf386]KQT91380.1 hypothetical protein ASG68_19965 [Rhizobium sp. Leaf453]
MWTETVRYLSDDEKRWLRKLGNWSEDYLSEIQIRQFRIDNAYTIKNALIENAPMKLVTSELSHDEDGALLDVILYKTDAGGFGELEFNRLDTKQLIRLPTAKG